MARQLGRAFMRDDNQTTGENRHHERTPEGRRSPGIHSQVVSAIVTHDRAIADNLEFGDMASPSLSSGPVLLCSRGASLQQPLDRLRRQFRIVFDDQIRAEACHRLIRIAEGDRDRGDAGLFRAENVAR